MTDGLKPAHRQAIIDALSANPKVERIVLFGSRATGTFTLTSDVDLALFGDDLTLSDQAALAEAVAELTVPQQVDLLDLSPHRKPGPARGDPQAWRRVVCEGAGYTGSEYSRGLARASV